MAAPLDGCSCYWRRLDVLTYLEGLRDDELVVLKFNFATKYKILYLKGHCIYSHDLIKSNVLLLSAEQVFTEQWIFVVCRC